MVTMADVQVGTAMNAISGQDGDQKDEQRDYLIQTMEALRSEKENCEYRLKCALDREKAQQFDIVTLESNVDNLRFEVAQYEGEAQKLTERLDIVEMELTESNQREQELELQLQKVTREKNKIMESQQRKIKEAFEEARFDRHEKYEKQMAEQQNEINTLQAKVDSLNNADKAMQEMEYSHQQNVRQYNTLIQNLKGEIDLLQQAEKTIMEDCEKLAWYKLKFPEQYLRQAFPRGEPEIKSQFANSIKDSVTAECQTEPIALSAIVQLLAPCKPQDIVQQLVKGSIQLTQHASPTLKGLMPKLLNEVRQSIKYDQDAGLLNDKVSENDMMAKLLLVVPGYAATLEAAILVGEEVSKISKKYQKQVNLVRDTLTNVKALQNENIFLMNEADEYRAQVTQADQKKAKYKELSQEYAKQLSEAARDLQYYKSFLSSNGGQENGHSAHMQPANFTPSTPDAALHLKQHQKKTGAPSESPSLSRHAQYVQQYSAINHPSNSLPTTFQSQQQQHIRAQQSDPARQHTRMASSESGGSATRQVSKDLFNQRSELMLRGYQDQEVLSSTSSGQQQHYIPEEAGVHLGDPSARLPRVRVNSVTSVRSQGSQGSMARGASRGNRSDGPLGSYSEEVESPVGNEFTMLKDQFIRVLKMLPGKPKDSRQLKAYNLDSLEGLQFAVDWLANLVQENGGMQGIGQAVMELQQRIAALQEEEEDVWLGRRSSRVNKMVSIFQSREQIYRISELDG